MFGLSFEPRTSLIRNKSANHPAAKFGLINENVTSGNFEVCEHNWSDNENGSRMSAETFFQEINFLPQRKYNRPPLQDQLINAM